ncbi:MAG TPA: nuclear transport factor 2 family protein [Burkholderiales bacterium]|nr:nuclear transport factor 2 family protein [Burkholderiales bacterium]
MRDIATLSIVLIAAACFSTAASAAQAGAEAEVEETLQAYEAAWSRHDAAAIASFFYEPALRVGRAGPVVRPTRADQEAFFSGFLPGLVQRGYERSRWEELNVHLLDAQTAIASGIVVRYRKDGSDLERVAVSYGLRKTERGWKIFLSDTHAPDTVMRFR